MSVIRFSNGVSVNFDGEPTQADIEEVAASVAGQGQAPEKPKASSYWNNKENGVLPYGKIQEALAPTPNPTGIQAPGTVAKNYGKSIVKAGVGMVGFLDPISNLKKVGEFGREAKGFASDVRGAQNARKIDPRLAQLIAERQSNGTLSPQASEAFNNQVNRQKQNPFSLVASEVPKAVYETIAPPALQAGIQQGMDAKKSGYSNKNSLLEGLAGTLQSGAEDPGQFLPLIMGGQKAIKNTKVGKAVQKSVSTVSKPIQTIVDAGVKKSTPALFSKSAEQMRTEKMQSGLKAQNQNTPSVGKSFNKNTKSFTDAEGNKTTVTPADTFAKYKISPEVKGGKMQMGDYKTGEGVLGKVKEQVSTLDNQIDSTLTGTGKTVLIETLRKQAIAKAKANPTLREMGTVQSTVNKLNNQFDDYRASYGQKMKVSDINNVRKTANADWKPETQDVSRIVGDTARDVVYKSSPSVRGLLREQGNLLAAKKYAETLNGKAVRGGRLGNYTGRVVGAMAGTTGAPVIGPILGALGGDLVARSLQSAQFNSPLAGLKGSGLPQAVIKSLSRTKRFATEPIKVPNERRPGFVKLPGKSPEDLAVQASKEYGSTPKDQKAFSEAFKKSLRKDSKPLPKLKPGSAAAKRAQALLDAMLRNED